MNEKDDPPPVLKCAGGCNREWLLNDIEKSGWDYLSISGRYRCQTCSRELRAASTIVGAPPAEFVDAVPPGSRGALPKETASTITPPTLRG